MANLVRSLLLYGMFDYRTIQRDGQWVQEFKASVHESAQVLGIMQPTHTTWNLGDFSAIERD